MAEEKQEVEAGEVALLPCPFCGARDPELSNGYDEDANWVVVCRSCKASGAFCSQKARAIKKWSARAALASIDSQ